jgi:GNAT superfamily N-acetyltransferase
MLNAHLRRATDDDAEGIAKVFSPSLRLLTFLPELHTVAEDRAFIRNKVLRECDVTVAEYRGGIVSFIALHCEEIRLLHTAPEFIGNGFGSLLVKEAQQSGAPALELWCFQQNLRARTFYERHGFRAVRFTDGEGNEEKCPTSDIDGNAPEAVAHRESGWIGSNLPGRRVRNSCPI